MLMPLESEDAMVGADPTTMHSVPDLAFAPLDPADVPYGMGVYGMHEMHDGFAPQGNDFHGGLDPVTALWQPMAQQPGQAQSGFGSRQPKIEKKVPSTIACRYGLKCFSKTCAFWHPPGRAADGFDSSDAGGSGKGPSSPPRKGATTKMYISGFFL